MEITSALIEQAYIKLRSNIYHDTTDLLLRRQLVEFETNMTKDHAWLLGSYDVAYRGTKNIFSNALPSLKEKFERIAHEIERYHEDPTFFASFIERTSIHFFPKKIASSNPQSNFITNRRVERRYEVERCTPFIHTPIELHLVAVVWIMLEGHTLDAVLSASCFGNRLLLNQNGSGVVQGSGLFKPYVSQYQRWRDESVKEAERLMANGRDVAFLNLDIKDYFNSVRVPYMDLEGERYKGMQAQHNLSAIFTQLHKTYTSRLFKAGLYHSSRPNESETHTALPIGLLSSYVLANDYLTKFDSTVLAEVRPAFYGRYVDDILMVIVLPEQPGKERDLLRDESAPDNLHEFVQQHLDEVLQYDEVENEATGRYLLKGYDGLYCQSEKTLLYLFDHQESRSVIGRLKQDLEDRSSEFRDFPDEADSDRAFKENAYHLYYDGTEGKVRTLKDYKENRYGLTVYLANKIFAGLRRDDDMTDSEADEVIRFFRGRNCLQFHRLWERILTLMLVNDKPDHYVRFYVHCLDEIEKLVPHSDLGGKVPKGAMIAALTEYLDCAHELSLSLNLGFVDKSQSAARDLEFTANAARRNHLASLFNDFEPTLPQSFWIRRFRRANMLRHHYVVHPLLTYSKDAQTGRLKDLTQLHFNHATFELAPDLLENSPRQVRFWECTLAQALIEITGYEPPVLPFDDPLSEEPPSHFLDRAWELFRTINQDHIPSYVLNGDSLEPSVFNTRIGDDGLTNEITVGQGDLGPASKFSIAFANTEVKDRNFLNGIRGTPDLGAARYKRLADILRKARKDRPFAKGGSSMANLLLLPECFLPIELLSSVTRYAAKNETLTITGLEHVTINDVTYNYIATILPVTIQGAKDAIVILRLKNHYSHSEEQLIIEERKKPAKPTKQRYDLFNWRNLYFAPYYCFELANVHHRSLFKSKLDLLIGVEWNKDTPYFSNIVESCSRDLHCYVAQVNTSQFGDTRLTQPKKTALKNILQLKGGSNDAVLLGDIDIAKLRAFQRKTYGPTHQQEEFKPLPPDFDHACVLKRIQNQHVL
jgi:hypothetical protein